MGKIRSITVLFFTLKLIYCQSQELRGSWFYKQISNNKTVATFTLTFSKKVNDTLYGRYCAIAREGRKIDCSSSEENNIKVVKHKRYYTVYFYSFFNAQNGVARILKKNGKLVWQVIASPNGEFYCPVLFTMTPLKPNER